MQGEGDAGRRKSRFEGLETKEHRISKELQMGHVAEAWTKGRKRGEELLG